MEGQFLDQSVYLTEEDWDLPSSSPEVLRMRVEVEGWVAFPTPGSVPRALRGGVEVRFMLIYGVSLS